MKKIFLALVTFLASTSLATTTYTTNYNLAKPGDGDTNWGSLLRDNFDSIDTQLYIDSTSISDHVADAIAAHAATAISASPGTLCSSADDVQEFLDCLDEQYYLIIGGNAVTISGTQTITGAKTFSAAITGTAGLSITGDVEFVSISDGVAKFTSGILSTSDVDLTSEVTGTLPISNGGTGASSLSSGIIKSNGSVLSSGTVDLTSNVNGVLPVTNGGTNLSSLGTGNQILGVNNGATAAEYKTLSGTSNQITVTHGVGSITLSTPQDIHTSATPTFGEITTSGLQASAAGGIDLQNVGGSSVLLLGSSSGTTAVFSGDITAKSSVKLEDPGAGTNAITLTAPSTPTAYTITLPSATPAPNTGLSYDGANYVWASVGGWSTSTQTTLSASGTITISLTQGQQAIEVSGNGAAVTLATAPFGSSDPNDKTVIRLIGRSNTNTVTINNSDSANGPVMNGNVTLRLGDVIDFMYVSSIDRWLETSRNF